MKFVLIDRVALWICKGWLALILSLDVCFRQAQVAQEVQLRRDLAEVLSKFAEQDEQIILQDSFLSFILLFI